MLTQDNIACTVGSGGFCLLYEWFGLCLHFLAF